MSNQSLKWTREICETCEEKKLFYTDLYGSGKFTKISKSNMHWSKKNYKFIFLDHVILERDGSILKLRMADNLENIKKALLQLGYEENEIKRWIEMYAIDDTNSGHRFFNRKKLEFENVDIRQYLQAENFKILYRELAHEDIIDNFINTTLIQTLDDVLAIDLGLKQCKRTSIAGKSIASLTLNRRVQIKGSKTLRERIQYALTLGKIINVSTYNSKDKETDKAKDFEILSEEEFILKGLEVSKILGIAVDNFAAFNAAFLDAFNLNKRMGQEYQGEYLRISNTFKEKETKALAIFKNSKPESNKTKETKNESESEDESEDDNKVIENKVIQDKEVEKKTNKKVVKKKVVSKSTSKASDKASDKTSSVETKNVKKPAVKKTVSKTTAEVKPVAKNVKKPKNEIKVNALEKSPVISRRKKPTKLAN